MLPTPAPTSPPGSPQENLEDKNLILLSDYPPPPQNIDSAPFAVLVGLFEKLQTERKPDKRRKLLEGWFNHWRAEKGKDLFPVLRLILPQKDKDRSLYGLKEKNLAKTYIKLIPLGTKDPDAVRLLNWKRPTEKEKTSGDFPTVVHDVVSKRSSIIQGSLSIDDLNEILDSLVENMGKQDMQSKILQRVYNRATPDEQRWIVRIILKDMNISVKETTVFSVFHPDAQDLYNTCSDLKKVAWTLWDASLRLNEEDKAIQLFRVFAPMLCKRPTKRIEESVREMQGKNFIIEEKLDGERIQLHKRRNEYFYCSRKGKDYTYLYGAHVGTGSLTPFIDSCFDPRVDEVVLDGEMLVWDPVSERNLPFGTLKTAALDKSQKEYNPRPCFNVFDLLYLNGRSLIHKSCKFRKQKLHECMQEVQGRIEFVTEYEGTTAKDVRQRMEDVMNARGEGLVLKHPDSQYVLNGRNKDWIKVKPEYMDNMGETVDVLVVAGHYGSGKRGGGVSTLICALLDDRHPEEDESKYTSFVRIGSGLSYADYMWVRSKPWKPWDPKDPPSFYKTSSKGHEDKGDVYIEPNDSFIIKVKAAEITASDQYNLGFTMRFPRALQIRDDLTIDDCMTASAILENVMSVRKRKLSKDDQEISNKKRKTRAKVPSMMPEFSGVGLDDIKAEFNLFKGLTFVISPDPKSQTQIADKLELQKLVKAYGGKLAQIATTQRSLYVVYGGSIKPPDINRIITKTSYDILKPQWIFDSVAKQKLMPFSKKYFFHASAQSRSNEDYDLHSDEDEESIPVDDEDEFMTPRSQTDRQGSPEAESALKFSPEDFKGKSIDRDETINNDDSETDHDSDNVDVHDAEETEDDDWFKVVEDDSDASTLATTRQVSQLEIQDERQNIKMGESDTAMEYDQNFIFKHLCFYLDSPENARKYDMRVKSKHEAEISKGFARLSTLIIENGGKVVDLDDPKLTHVVLDQRDDGRRLELVKRTSKPKRRNIVISQFIEACLDEGTLLDENEFTP